MFIIESRTFTYNLGEGVCVDAMVAGAATTFDKAKEMLQSMSGYQSEEKFSWWGILKITPDDRESNIDFVGEFDLEGNPFKPDWDAFEKKVKLAFRESPSQAS